MKPLIWFERALLTTGLISAGWVGLVMTEARFVGAMSAPPAASAIATADAVVPRGSWVARLEAPSAKLSATVLEGSDDKTLRRAAGHIEGTAFPGDDGNIGIAGHRDTTFSRVQHLKLGDTITLETLAGEFEYRVSKTMIVQPDAIEVLDPTPQPTLTLVTCYPFTYLGNAPKRYILRAELIHQRLN
jgi:sortase A